ncbi:hypothetical protein OXYTRIMIC_538 [Oxytricha trifallax]|uniref:Transcription factor CBF/NF-Y/archaeal histone domain-containing protein n=1 Tax=Oxytricha trifallax TaxID=1172189 RepID=A0A073I123_9SPIT|nr:hypothetical protein OXYTRIMIC_538 [Oxytricha trifallax]
MSIFDKKEQFIAVTKIEKIIRNTLSEIHNKEQLQNYSQEYDESATLSSYNSQAPRFEPEMAELMQQMLTEFICFVTHDMTEEISKERRVAIKGTDLIESLQKLGFQHFTPPLEVMLPRLI